MSAAAAKPAKLSDGTWGARVTDAICVGASIVVTTAGGKSWVTQVTEVVSRQGASTIVRTGKGGSSRPAARRAAPKRRSRYSCGYACPVSRRPCTDSDPCHDCQ